MWLEIAKLIVSALTPVAVVVLGVRINHRLKDLEQRQWRNRKLIEKRIEIYDEISPELNDLFCYFMWIGEWQKKSPVEIVAAKRSLDRKVHIYRFLLLPEFFRAYEQFMAVVFSTYNGAGEDARLRTDIGGPDGDRRTSPHFKWLPEWDRRFDVENIATKDQLSRAYLAVMKAQQSGIDLAE